MSRKRKELPLIEGVEITGIAAEGKSIARVGELVVFVPYGCPGDVVDIKIDKKRSNYAEAHIVRLVSPANQRVKPVCEHFGVCGGCKWQHIPYTMQLECKRQQVVDALERIAKVDLPPVNEIVASAVTERYRNKLEFTFSSRRWLTFEQIARAEEVMDRNALGFHIPGSFDKVLDIEHCWLQDEISDRIRLYIRSLAISKGYAFYDIKGQHGLLRNMIVRTASTGEVMLIVVFGEDNQVAIGEILSDVAKNFPQITSLMYVINLKVNDSIADQEVHSFSGTPYINEQMEGLTFRVGPKSFYQTNSNQAYELYKVARRMAALGGDELVYDLYTGTGTIANFVARNAKLVIGIEYVEDAVADAKLNSQLNSIANTRFFAGDMKDVLSDEFVAQNGRPDVIIVDPPRAGMHKDVVDVILRASPDRIVYVSCNPATQARDIAMLDAKYRVVEVQPVDMFPHTHHVENVVLLMLKGHCASTTSENGA